jgi:DnaJ-class molecular chaperone
VNARFINCEVCQTEGRIYTANGPECNGERVVEVETHPITMGDLDA